MIDIEVVIDLQDKPNNYVVTFDDFMTAANQALNQLPEQDKHLIAADQELVRLKVYYSNIEPVGPT